MCLKLSTKQIIYSCSNGAAIKNKLIHNMYDRSDRVEQGDFSNSVYVCVKQETAYK